MKHLRLCLCDRIGELLIAIIERTLALMLENCLMVGVFDGRCSGNEKTRSIFFSTVFCRNARSISTATICTRKSRSIKSSMCLFFFNQIGATSRVDFTRESRFSILGWYL
jgi:hypothetical protein